MVARTGQRAIPRGIPLSRESGVRGPQRRLRHRAMPRTKVAPSAEMRPATHRGAPLVTWISPASPPNFLSGAGAQVVGCEPRVLGFVPLACDGRVRRAQRCSCSPATPRTERTCAAILRAVANDGLPFVARILAAQPPCLHAALRVHRRGDEALVETRVPFACDGWKQGRERSFGRRHGCHAPHDRSARRETHPARCATAISLARRLYSVFGTGQTARRKRPC